jgi:hypothetical protein
MAVRLSINFPVANPLRFTRDGVTNNQRAAFDQVRFSQAKNAGMDTRTYDQLFENSDPLQVQFFSNFPNNKVGVYECGNVTPLVENIPSVRRQYKGLEYHADVKVSSLNGFLFVYFDIGYTYTDDTYTTQIDAISYQGRTPNVNIEVGNLISITYGGNTYVANINAISWNPTLQAEGYVLDIVSALSSSVDGKASITYNEKPFDLYYLDIDLSGLDEVRHYIKVSAGVGTELDEEEEEIPLYQYTFTSEPISIETTQNETLAIDYSQLGTFYGADAFGFIYEDGYLNRIRLEASFNESEPSGEIEVYNDDTGVLKKIRAIPYRSVSFKAELIPTWLADKLNVILAHDTLLINGNEYQCEDFGTRNYIQLTDIGEYVITLRQVNDRLNAENEIELDFTATFDPESIEDDGSGGAYPLLFETNFGGSFYWTNLPSWITSDVSTFADGDTVTLTVAESFALERFVNLVATNDDIQLSVIVGVVQQEGTLTDEIISVTPDNYTYEIGLGVTLEIEVEVLNLDTQWQVTSNKTWAIVPSGIFTGDDTFDINILEPQSNLLGNAVVTVTNINNPADFKVVNINAPA